MSQRKSQSARANGAQSHGPATPEGRAKSSRNSLRHGLSARQIVLPNEDPGQFHALLDAYFDQFQPATPIETEMVEAMAAARWRLRRLIGIETDILTRELGERTAYMDRYDVTPDPHARIAFVFQKLADNTHSLALLARYESSLNRVYDRAFKQLQMLQSERRRQAQQSEARQQNEPTAAADPPRPAPPTPAETAPNPPQPQTPPSPGPREPATAPTSPAQPRALS